ncbi:melanocyte-stimulating hormone receptor-like [Oculina patagonica]
MANLTGNGTIKELFCMPDLFETHQKIIISALNIPLSIVAFFGNILIIAALQKVSSLHPPSKLLLGCLASTDLCVGLITQPLFVTYVMSSQHLKRCHYVQIIFKPIGAIFSGISLLTLTAISVDRLLALTLGLRYRQVVTLKRVWILVATFWLSNTATAVIFFYTYRIATGIACIVVILCIVTSTFCYVKIYFTLRHHQAQVKEHVHQGQPNGGGAPLNIARYRKTVSSALWVQLTLLACYLPFGIATALQATVGYYTTSRALASAVTLSLLYVNSSLNPFLYCWKMKEVRQAVKDTIRHNWKLLFPYETGVGRREENRPWRNGRDSRASSSV